MANSGYNTDLRVQGSNPQLKQLDKLEEDLLRKLKHRQEHLNKTGLVTELDLAKDSHIQTINSAIGKVQKAREDVLGQQVTNYLVGTGHIPQSKPDSVPTQVDAVSDHEAVQLSRIRSVPRLDLVRGQQFASLSGKEPSYNHYMKTNIQGLFSLLDSKSVA